MQGKVYKYADRQSVLWVLRYFIIRSVSGRSVGVRRETLQRLICHIVSAAQTGLITTKLRT